MVDLARRNERLDSVLGLRTSPSARRADFGDERIGVDGLTAQQIQQLSGQRGACGRIRPATTTDSSVTERSLNGADRPQLRRQREMKARPGADAAASAPGASAQALWTKIEVLVAEGPEERTRCDRSLGVVVPSNAVVPSRQDRPSGRAWPGDRWYDASGRRHARRSGRGRTVTRERLMRGATEPSYGLRRRHVRCRDGRWKPVEDGVGAELVEHGARRGRRCSPRLRHFLRNGSRRSATDQGGGGPRQAVELLVLSAGTGREHQVRMMSWAWRPQVHRESAGRQVRRPQPTR